LTRCGCSKLVLTVCYNFAALLVLCCPSLSQVTVDIDAETARRAANRTFLEDLAVNDNAYTYQNFCIKEDALYLPGWTTPINYTNDTYTASGIVVQVRILPGKRLAARFVDARQTQLKAQGNPTAPAILSKEEYNKSVRDEIENIFSGGFFGTPLCDDVIKANPLRKADLFAVDSLNGYKRLSELLKAVSAPAPR
jgi:hypothetical protein